MKKAKFLFVGFLVVLMLGLAACGKKKGAEEEDDNIGYLDPAIDGGGFVDYNPEHDGNVPDPELEPEYPDLFEDDQFEGWSNEMSEIKNAIVEELGEDYWPSSPMTADYINMLFGINPEAYEDYFGEMPMMSVQIDTLIILKAAEGQADMVEEAFNNYRQTVLDNSMQYPMNVAKSQACKVARVGDYVCFVLLGGDITEYEEKGDEAIIIHCMEDNDRVIEIIKEKVQ